jgi:type I restriction enzyme, R subunit
LLHSIDGLARWLGPWMGLVPHQQVSTKAAAEEAKKARNRYHHAVVNLSKAYAPPAPAMRPGIRDAVGFFQTIRLALGKDTARKGMSLADRELAIRQILGQSSVAPPKGPAPDPH